MFKSLIFFVYLVLGTLPLCSSFSAEKQKLKITDVRNLMEEMFTYHIETKEITPALVKRSFKIFLEQFDPQKIYLIQSEIKPYLDIPLSEINSVIDHFYTDNYSEFEKLNRTIEKAIYRARQWRQEFYKDFISQGEKLHPSSSDQIFQYTSTTDQLKKRLRFQLYQVFLLENRFNDPNFWTIERRKKICNLFEKRFIHYEDSYLIEKDEDKHYFSLHILKALSRGLDPHTTLFSHEEASEMRLALEKQFEGVGIILRESLDGVEIADLVKGGPAERSGKIQIGDVIVQVDGKNLQEATYQEVLQELKGSGNKAIVLGMTRIKHQTEPYSYKVELKKEKILIEGERLSYTTEPYQDGVIGKLILPSFYEGTGSTSSEADIRAALREIKKKGKVLGLIIDMRNNLGGFLSQSVKVAGLFITSGVVVISKYSQGEIQYLRNIGPQVYYDGPLVIMTSKVTASAAEIVAQTLQDYGVAVIVGDERTYGKGTIQYQTITNPEASSFFKVTVGKYYTVSGKSTQIDGVKADIVVPTSFAPYNIGERYLEYALQSDQVSSVYMDPLHDVAVQNKVWFQKNYLPYLQKKERHWEQMLDHLQTESQSRLEQNSQFNSFLKNLNAQNEPVEPRMDDLQMKEAINILKDMILSGASLDYSRS